MTLRAGTALVATALLALPAAARADWPVYGHDLANTRTAADEGPGRDKLGSISQAWRFESDTGDFTGTPVVADGVVVAGDQGGWVYALDAVTGRKLWSRDLGAPVHASAAIDAGAPGGALVLVPVGEVGAPRLAALSLADGGVRW